MTSLHNAELNAAGAGLAMLASAFLAVLAMAHHPTGIHGPAGLNAIVHGGMMVFLLVFFVGFAQMSRRRGLENTLVLAALAAYGANAGAHLGAATINGFVVPALAAKPQQPAHDLFLLCWEANQALAGLGVYATGAAYVLWSLDLLRGPGMSNRLVAFAGIAAGAAPIAALASGALRMDVHGALIVYAVHALWAALVAVQLVRRKL